jgi:hypothetical protein
MARFQLCATLGFLLLFGCSSEGDADGGATGSGTLDGGGAFAVNSAGEEFAPATDGTTPDLSGVGIHMSQVTWPCDGGKPAGFYLRFEAATDGGGPLAPGTYPVDFFSMQGVDPTTQLPASYSGADGDVTFTTIDAQSAVGSFSVQVFGLGDLEGTFEAPFCGLRQPLH